MHAFACTIKMWRMVVGELDPCGLLGAPVCNVMRSACIAALTTFVLIAQFRLHCAHAEYRGLYHGPWLHCTFLHAFLNTFHHHRSAHLVGNNNCHLYQHCTTIQGWTAIEQHLHLQEQATTTSSTCNQPCTHIYPCLWFSRQPHPPLHPALLHCSHPIHVCISHVHDLSRVS